MKPHWILFPFSMIYGLAVQLRNLFFDIGILSSVDVGVPVISIGNVTAGGTGKTPLVIETVRILREAGKTPAIISRGYGRATHGTVVACDGQSIIASAMKAGDEPVLIAQKTGHSIVISDENRVRGARLAVKEYGADVIVLDDGFQHRYLKRKKDIVLIDSQQPPFATMLLPAGYRRESMRSLRRADAVMVTRSESAAGAEVVLSDARMKFEGKKFSSAFRPVGIRNVFGGIAQSLEILKGHSAVVFSGIAHPEGFRKSVEACGVEVKKLISFPDHHRFTEADIASVIDSFHACSADFILTTEKDGVRLTAYKERFSSLPVSVLVMDVEVHQHEAWKQFLLNGISQ